MLETRWRLLTGPRLRASWLRRSPSPASSDPVPALCTHTQAQDCSHPFQWLSGHIHSLRTQAHNCSHPFQWPFRHTCSLHTHRHKTAVIHSNGYSDTYTLCAHTGTRLQSSIPQPLRHTCSLHTHTQAQDSSHPFHSHSNTPALCTHRHKTAVIYSNGHSNTHALCTHRHLLPA